LEDMEATMRDVVNDQDDNNANAGAAPLINASGDAKLNEDHESSGLFVPDSEWTFWIPLSLDNVTNLFLLSSALEGLPTASEDDYKQGPEVSIEIEGNTPVGNRPLLPPDTARSQTTTDNTYTNQWFSGCCPRSVSMMLRQRDCPAPHSGGWATLYWFPWGMG
jgi:hypothetical protein